MLRVARLLRGTSPFTVFLMDQKSNPSLKGVPIPKRGRMLSKMYKELSAKERQDLKKRAMAHPSVNKQKPRKKPTRKSEFSKFVKDNYKSVQGLNYAKRFAALSQLYELRKPLDEQVAKVLKIREAKKSVAPAKGAVKKAAAKQKAAAKPKAPKSAPSSE